MDIQKIKAQSERKCPKCAQNQKAFIKLDDENIRRCMKYEDKILELKAEIKRLKAEHNSGNQNKKKVLEKVGQPVSNTASRHFL